jgi:hypothetical protein
LIEIKKYDDGFVILGHAAITACSVISNIHYVTSNLLNYIDERSGEKNVNCFASHESENETVKRFGLSWCFMMEPTELQKRVLERLYQIIDAVVETLYSDEVKVTYCRDNHSAEDYEETFNVKGEWM